MREAAARGPCATARSEVQLALCMPTLPCPVTSILTPLVGSRPRFIPATRTTRSPRPLIAPSSTPSLTPTRHAPHPPFGTPAPPPQPAPREAGVPLKTSKAAAFARMRGMGGRGRSTATHYAGWPVTGWVPRAFVACWLQQPCPGGARAPNPCAAPCHNHPSAHTPQGPRCPPRGIPPASASSWRQMG